MDIKITPIGVPRKKLWPNYKQDFSQNSSDRSEEMLWSIRAWQRGFWPFLTRYLCSFHPLTSSFRTTPIEHSRERWELIFEGEIEGFSSTILPHTKSTPNHPPNITIHHLQPSSSSMGAWGRARVSRFGVYSPPNTQSLWIIIIRGGNTSIKHVFQSIVVALEFSYKNGNFA